MNYKENILKAYINVYNHILIKYCHKISVTSSSPLQDRTFVTREWYKKYQDSITPIGLAFYQSDWDLSVRSFFHNTLNIKEPGKPKKIASFNFKLYNSEQQLKETC